MHAFWSTAFAVTAILGMTGAATADEKMFASVVLKMNSDPKFYQQIVDYCIAGVLKDPNAIEFNMRVTGLSREKAPIVSCQRIMKAYKSGRYTYKHQVGVAAGNYDPEVIKILQGR
ncbi:hypothetical protein [Methylopila sp. M107]|uniref:hypothetical protein n=1 Tax=Methylopila sp. M107 TaxID=1101190 RepID=UPI00036DCC11|nr:hypothetical protein [Methylopila sp. M107]